MDGLLPWQIIGSLKSPIESGYARNILCMAIGVFGLQFYLQKRRMPQVAVSLLKFFFDAAVPISDFDSRTSALDSGILTSLVLCGLLSESFEDGRKLVDRVYRKTPLWNAVFRLADNDH